VIAFDTAEMGNLIFNNKYKGMIDFRPSKITGSWRDIVD
jgi:hypothetical protein